MKFVVLKVLVLSLFLCSTFSGLAYAKPSKVKFKKRRKPPKIISVNAIKSDSSTILLNWELNRSAKRNSEKLLIFREIDKEKTLLRKIVKPEKEGELIDPVEEKGVVSYRVRTKSGRRFSRNKWSNVLLLQEDKLLEEAPVIQPPKKDITPYKATKLPLAIRGTRNCPQGEEEEVFRLINIERKNAEGVEELCGNTFLDQSARSHSLYMTGTQELTHEGWLSFILDTGYYGLSLGENIAFGYDTPQHVVEAWMNSPGHRRNILKPKYKEIGIGCIVDSSGTKWWTQHFGG